MKRILVCTAVVLFSGLSLIGCSDDSVSVATATPTPTPTATPAPLKLSGTVSGLAGNSVVLANGSDRVTVTANGNFEFTTDLTDGGTYNVVVKSKPQCVTQTCTVTNGSGTVSGASVGNVQVTCTSDSRTRLFTASWGDSTIRITDDFNSLANGASASPRTITGFTSINQKMGITVDQLNDVLYVSDSGVIEIYNNASTALGALTPNRSIAAGGSLYSVAIDPTNDRLYVVKGTNTLVFDNASTLDGTVTASQTIATGAGVLFYDSENDRLYALSNGGTIKVYNTAKNLTSSSTADRTITLTGFVSTNVTSLWVDPCSNRLYVTNRGNSNGGFNLAGFASASTLSGTIDFDTDSLMQATVGTAMNVAVDPFNNLFTWTDSANSVRVYTSIDTATGDMGAQDKSISAAISSGYGLWLTTY